MAQRGGRPFPSTGLPEGISFCLAGLARWRRYACMAVAGGAAFAEYNPRIMLAGFVIRGYGPRVSCPALLTVLTFICFGLFSFTPLILDMVEAVAMKRSVAHVGQDMAVTYRAIYEALDGTGVCGTDRQADRKDRTGGRKKKRRREKQ